MSQRGFAAIPNHVIRDSSLPPSSRLLYGVILSYAFAGRRCTASTARLCEETGIGRSAFFAALKVLDERGLIAVEKVKTDRGWRNTYKPITRELRVEEGEDEESDIRTSPGGSSARPDGGSSGQPDTEEDQTEEDNCKSPNGLSSGKPDGADEKRVVGSLIDYWKARCQHPAAKATRDRRQKVTARLRDGYSSEDIKAAIDGAAVGAFVNDAGKRFDDIELICRNGSKLESFMDRARSAPVRNGTVHPISAARKPSPDQLLAELNAANPRLHGDPAAAIPERT